MTCQVRLIMPQDINEVFSLARLAIEEAFPHLEFDADRAVDLFTRSVVHGDPLGLVAEIDGEIVGMFAARIHAYAFASGLFVQDEIFYVRPDKRGSRAAAKMLREYIRWGEEDVGAKEIFLGTNSQIRSERTSALYEYFGARRIGFLHRIVR